MRPKTMPAFLAAVALAGCAGSLSVPPQSALRNAQGVIEQTEHQTFTFQTSIGNCAGQFIPGTMEATFTFGAAGQQLEHFVSQTRFLSEDGLWYSRATQSDNLSITTHTTQSVQFSNVHLFYRGHPVELDHEVLHFTLTPSLQIEHFNGWERCSV